MSKKAAAANNRCGWVLKQDGAAFVRLFLVLKGKEASISPSDAKDARPLLTASVEDAAVAIPDISRVSKRHALEISFPGAAAGVGPGGSSWVLATESKEEQEAWLQCLAAAAVSETWPGGNDSHNRPLPLLFSLWLVHSRRGPAAPGAAASAPSASPFAVLPAIKSVPVWQRKCLVLRKLRQCSVTFDGCDTARHAEEREAKRNTLLELVDYADEAGAAAGGAAGGAGAAAVASAARAAFGDLRLLEDLFAMVRCNLFRALPVAPPPSGDPDEEDLPFQDPQWPHLNIVYELLLRLVAADSIDLTLKKRLLDTSFVTQLMALFDSEDIRERDYLKTIVHRMYSKLTQRRALIRRLIGSCFSEFALESEQRRGVGEQLEILASVINGFAVPVKDEHRHLLTRALLPLHKCASLAAFHPQLCYALALFAAKEHTLTRDMLLSGLLRYWPFGATAKQMLFLNELEDLFEYAQEDDVGVFRDALALRLAKCIGGLHFQVAERALTLWSNERISALLLVHPEHRRAVLPVLYPALAANVESHWHEAIRTLSGSLLDQYVEVDASLVDQCREDLRARLDDAAAAAPAASPAAGRPSAASSSSSSSAAAAGLAGTLASMALASSSSSPPPPAAASPSPHDAAATAAVSTPRGAGVASADEAPPFSAAASGASPSTLHFRTRHRDPGTPLGTAAGLRAISSGSPSPAATAALAAALSSPATGPHAASRAPAVRTSQGFGVLRDADLLPGHRDPAVPGAGSPQGRGRDRLPHLLSPLGTAMGDGDGEAEV